MWCRKTANPCEPSKSCREVLVKCVGLVGVVRVVKPSGHCRDLSGCFHV